VLHHDRARGADDLGPRVGRLGVAPSDINEKRAALIGFLTMRSTPGDARFAPQEFLAQAKLSGIPLSARERSAATARKLFDDDADRAGYTSAVRIDRSLVAARDRRITCFSGPSGHGKSWGMVAAAERIAAEYDHLIVYIRATGDAARDFDEAAAKVSREVLGRAETHSLRELALDVKELLPDDGQAWLTICVDDVQRMDEAEGLLVNDRELDRVRVLFTAPAAAAQALRSRPHVAVVDVDIFTKAELQQYLEQHGWDWSEVPSDIRQLIRQPLLTRVFIDVAGDPEWKGTTEYALLEAYWHRLTSGSQTDYPQDSVMLRDLSFETAQGRVSYPWDARALREAGIDDVVRRRLERAGWLRRQPDAGASIWHDRLLNWAVAEALVGNIRSGAAAIDELASALVGCVPPFRHSRYGYVTMDALWLASAEAKLSTEDIVGVLRKLEEHHELRFDSLYGELVPTLGQRILSALITRIKRINPDHRHETPTFAAALYATVRDELSSDDVSCLLAHDNARVQDVGLRYVTKSPRRELLDNVWKLHVERQSSGAPELRHIDYEITYAALAAGRHHTPDWLRQRINESTAESARVFDLAFLLAGLGNEAGAEMWRDTKEHLFAIVPDAHARSLVRCIHSYKDRDEIKRLVRWLREENDWVRPAALAALATLDADAAIAALERLPPTELGLARSWWMPSLMLKASERVQEHVRQRLLAAPEAFWDAAQYFSGLEDLIDCETLERLLQMIVARIPEYLLDTAGRRRGRPDVLLRVIADCTRASQIRVLESHRDDDTEGQLTQLATRWLAEDRHIHELEYLRVILQRIGGGGYVAFARESLRSLGPNDYSSDLDVAEPCASDVTPELQAVADRFIDADPQSQAHIIAFYALRLLAAVGDRERLIAAALKRAHNIERDVPALLAGHAALNDTSFAELLTRLKTSHGEEQERVAYALGMTGRADAIPHLQKVSSEAARSETRIAAHYALDALINEGLVIEPSAISSSVDRAARFRVLLRIGTTEALDELENELLAIDSNDSDVLDIGAALLDPIRGPRVGEWMWRNMQSHHVVFWHSRWWNALRYVAEGPDILSEYATDGPLSVRRFATAALAGVDGNATSSMIERLMRSYESGHAGLAEIYLRGHELERAAAFLRDHMIAETNESCRMAIGRAFRRHPEIIETMVPEMFRSPDADSRRCACEIAGWLRGAPHADDLQTLAFEDRSLRVSDAAIDALRRQSEFTAAAQLRSKLILLCHIASRMFHRGETIRIM
jgi:hypothetical protein